MIEIDMTVRQEGEEVKTIVRAHTNDTSTPAEMKEVDLIIAGVQRYLLERGREGHFIERKL